MNEEQKLTEVMAGEGWGESTAIAVLLEYIENQQAPDAFADFLDGKRLTDERLDVAATNANRECVKCGHCWHSAVEDEPCPECESTGSTALRGYLVARRQTIEASIAAERLAGNEHKEACERAALAELEALERRLPELASR